MQERGQARGGGARERGGEGCEDPRRALRGALEAGGHQGQIEGERQK